MLITLSLCIICKWMILIVIIMKFVMRIAIVAVLLGYVLCANMLYIDDGTNPNGNLSTISKMCASAPVSNLNLCNNTCQECTSSNSYKCISCNSAMYFQTDHCFIDNNIHNFTIYNYLKDLNANLMIKDIQQFVYSDSNTSISSNRIIGVCAANSYQLFMAGLFKVSDFVGINYQFVDKVDQVQIKFNFMAVIQDITLHVEVNDQVFFLKTYNIFSDLTGTYVKNATGVGPYYLTLPALNAANVGSVIAPVDTGLKGIISNAIRINIFITSSQSGLSWGFNDFVVIMRACQTCVTQAVQDILDRLIVLCYSVLIAVVALIVILLVMIKFEDLKRHWDFQEKLGSSADSLPLKAINRVIDSLQRSTRTMNKEFKREDKRFLRLFKRE